MESLVETTYYPLTTMLRRLGQSSFRVSLNISISIGCRVSVKWGRGKGVGVEWGIKFIGTMEHRMNTYSLYVNSSKVIGSKAAVAFRAFSSPRIVALLDALYAEYVVALCEDGVLRVGLARGTLECFLQSDDL
jgi:hypothetical protein